MIHKITMELSFIHFIIYTLYISYIKKSQINWSEKKIRKIYWNSFIFSSHFKVLTKDSVTVSVDAVVYYRVSNATVSIANVENAHHSTRLLAQTTLRNTMGTRHLHEILAERMTISGTMQVQLDEVTEAWGIKVERVEV